MASGVVTIEPVTTHAQVRSFIMFPFELYRSDPNWVPPLINERFKHFDPKRNPFYEYASTQLYLAKRDGKLVGTIAAIDNPKHQEVWGENIGFWGEFETINDNEVSSALFDAARAWLRSRGREVMRGPMNMNINEEIGLLIEGYDGPPVLMMTYNPPYYQDLIERYGFAKAKDVYAFKIDLDYLGPHMENLPAQVMGAAAIAESRYHVRIRHLNPKEFDKEVELIKPIYRKAWQANWGALPMTDAEFGVLAENLKTMADWDVTYLAFIDDEPIGAFIAVPDFCQVALHLGGRLLPFGWINYLRYKPRIKGMRVLIMGVLEEHRLKGVEALFYREGFKQALSKGIEWGEMSWILEDNYKVMRGVEKVGGKKYRSYRLYDLPVGA
ncbi:MAG: N-acetyltransferase [Chloroflexi bacterium]|nr:N-acetyltransferase [Chloroflexota bacterium]